MCVYNGVFLLFCAVLLLTNKRNNDTIKKAKYAIIRMVILRHVLIIILRIVMLLQIIATILGN